MKGRFVADSCQGLQSGFPGSGGHQLFSFFLLVFLLLGVQGSVLAGVIVLSTSPPLGRAEVRIDDKVVGKTSEAGGLVIPNVDQGLHTVAVRLPTGGWGTSRIEALDGSLAAMVSVDVGASSGASSGKSEAAAPVNLLISGNVGGARIDVDGRKVGNAGREDGSLLISIQPGIHDVSLSAPNYSGVTKRVSLEPGKNGRVLFELHHQAGSAGHESAIVTFVLIGLLVVVVGAIVLVAVVLVRRSARERVGTQRIDRYQLGAIIGRGGMATIYRASDRANGKRTLALKVLDPAYLQDQDLVRKFLREGEVLQKIRESDPDAPVVSVLHFGRAGSGRGLPFIAMELVEGVDLLTMLKRKGSFKPAVACGIVEGVARALEPAHAMGVYHRDLTPDNVMMTQKKRGGYPLRLIDFGVARHEYTSHGTLDGSIAGKPPYMSPEQCRGVPVDGRSDIYSLGVMLYTLVHGSPPFVNANPLEVMRMHQESPVSFPPDLPDALTVVLDRALKKKPEDRYRDISQFRAELIRMRSIV